MAAKRPGPKPRELDPPEDEPSDWIGADSVRAYWKAWRNIHDGTLVRPADEPEEERDG